MKKEELALRITNFLKTNLKCTKWTPADASDYPNCDENTLHYNPDTLNVEIPILEDDKGLRFIVTIEDLRENIK